jgi:hypothetical protein
MQRGYMQGFEVFAREASELLVNRHSNEVVNIASTEMMKKLLAGSIVQGRVVAAVHQCS